MHTTLEMKPWDYPYTPWYDSSKYVYVDPSKARLEAEVNALREEVKFLRGIVSNLTASKPCDTSS